MALAFVGVATERSPAAAFPYLVRDGDTLAVLGDRFFGDRSQGAVIALVNELPRPEIRAGQTLQVPSVSRYRCGRGETLELLAGRFLGDRRRAPFLARWNDLPADRSPVPGQEIVIPFQLSYRVLPGDTVRAVAERVYGEPVWGDLLLAYNFRRQPRLVAGEKLIVPLPELRLRRGNEAAPAAPKQRSEERLVAIEQAYRNGQYAAVPPALSKLLGEETLSMAQKASVHRLLGSAYVALGVEEVAVREFREALRIEPGATMDPVQISPKIRTVYERARQRP